MKLSCLSTHSTHSTRSFICHLISTTIATVPDPGNGNGHKVAGRRREIMGGEEEGEKKEGDEEAIRRREEDGTEVFISIRI